MRAVYISTYCYYLVLRNAHLLPVMNTSSLWPRFILVVGILLHVRLGQPRLLLVKWLFLFGTHVFPSRAQNFGNVRVVHVGILGQNLSPFVLCPHHKSVHWTFNML